MRALEVLEEHVELLEPLLPILPIARQPVRGLLKRFWLEVTHTRGRAPPPRDQPGLLENLEMAGDRRLRDPERRTQFADVRVAGRQPRQDRASCGVREGSKHRVQSVL